MPPKIQPRLSAEEAVRRAEALLAYAKMRSVEEGTPQYAALRKKWRDACLRAGIDTFWLGMR